MIRTNIIEDEPRNALMLQEMLKIHCPEIEVLGLAEDIDEASRLVEETQPQLLFLDIELPSGSAFDLLMRYDKLPFHIVFTTAYSQYALKALKVGALDYLLKPIAVDELKSAMEKVQQRIHTEMSKSDLIPLMEEIRRIQKIKKLCIPGETGKIFIDQSEIMYLKAEGSYTHFHLNGGRSIMASRNLKEFENQVDSSLFIRIHHSSIVNINFVFKYVKGRGGSVILTDGTELDVSARRKQDLLKAL